MGHTDQVQFALAEIEKNLRYKLDPDNCDQLRTAIQFCGMERFRLCLKLVSLMGDYGPRGVKLDGGSRHRVLITLMRLTAPHKGPVAKLRSPRAEYAKAVNDRLDQQALLAVDLDED